MDTSTTINQLQNLLQTLDVDGLMKLVQAFADEQRERK